MYVDYMLLVSNNQNDLQCLLKILTEELDRFGIKINMTKTNKMSILPELASSMTETNDELEEVKQFQYLGSVLTSNNSLDAEIYIYIYICVCVCVCVFLCVCVCVCRENSFRSSECFVDLCDFVEKGCSI